MSDTFRKHRLIFTSFYTILSPVVFMVVTFVLGFLSPGYDTYKHTISRLLVMPYGWIQQVNFLQYAISVVLTGHLISKSLQKNSSKMFILNSSYFCFVVLTLSALFTPENIDNVFSNLDKLTPNTIWHIIVILGFVFTSPMGIFTLTKYFKNEILYKDLVLLTKVFGYGAFSTSLIWIVFYYKEWFFDYKGIFEKIIAIWVIIWIEIINIRAIKNLLVQKRTSNS